MSNLSPAAVLHNTSSVEVGTATDPLRTDPTGTTAQPVSGTVDVGNFPAVQPVSDNSGSLTVDGPLTDAELRASSVPVLIDAASPKVLDQYNLMLLMYTELGRIRVLLEILTDEKVEGKENGHDD